MSQSGKLTFFTVETRSINAGLLTAVVQWSRSPRPVMAYRTRGPSHEWKEFLASLDEEWEPVTVHDASDLEQIPADVSLTELEQFVRPNSVLMVELAAGPLSRRVAEAITVGIPPEVRGTFVPRDLSVSAGWHDIFECAENLDGHLFGRTVFSVDFFSYGTPRDWDAFRDQVFRLPEIVAIRRELELITGPVEQCVYWEV